MQPASGPDGGMLPTMDAIVPRSSGCTSSSWPAFSAIHLITRVPPLLHTPLMSATNAISGISLIGSLSWSSAKCTLGQHLPRFHRRGLLGDQRGRRLPHHRPHAQDVQERARDKAGAVLSERRCLVVAGVVILVAGTGRASGGGTYCEVNRILTKCCAISTSSPPCCSSSG